MHRKLCLVLGTRVKIHSTFEVTWKIVRESTWSAGLVLSSYSIRKWSLIRILDEVHFSDARTIRNPDGYNCATPWIVAKAFPEGLSPEKAFDACEMQENEKETRSRVLLEKKITSNSLNRIHWKIYTRNHEVVIFPLREVMKFYLLSYSRLSDNWGEWAKERE